MATASQILHRRKVRALEGKRDGLAEKISRARADLTKVRAELKHTRKEK